jgi:hypothetical protein
MHHFQSSLRGSSYPGQHTACFYIKIVPQHSRDLFHATRREWCEPDGARRTKLHRVLVTIGDPPTSAFVIFGFVATSMPIRVGYRAPIRLSMAHWPKRSHANSEICDAGLRVDLCPRPCRRCRCRIFGRFALTICTCCLQNTTFLNPRICFSRKASSGINLFLTGSHSRESLQNRRWAKMPQTAPPNLQILFDGTVSPEPGQSGLVALGEAYGASKSSGRLSVLLDGLV